MESNNQHFLPVLKEEGLLTFVNSPPCQSSDPQALRIRTAQCLWNCERFRKKTGVPGSCLSKACVAACVAAAGTFKWASVGRTVSRPGQQLRFSLPPSVCEVCSFKLRCHRYL